MLAALGVAGFMGSLMAMFGGTNAPAVRAPDQAFDT
jgi:hypothetical protein